MMIESLHLMVTFGCFPGALELMQNFKSIKSEGAIHKQMMDKFNDILAQVS